MIFKAILYVLALMGSFGAGCVFGAIKDLLVDWRIDVRQRRFIERERRNYEAVQRQHEKWEKEFKDRVADVEGQTVSIRSFHACSVKNCRIQSQHSHVLDFCKRVNSK